MIEPDDLPVEIVEDEQFFVAGILLNQEGVDRFLKQSLRPGEREADATDGRMDHGTPPILRACLRSALVG